METYNIKGVEIFAEGTWNGDRFTKEDLNKMVQAFNETAPGIRPFLKLGHDANQKLLQKDGMPAAGWIESLYVSGDKLLADFTDIPKKIYDLIKSKAYRKVSSEIFYNLTVNDRKYQYLLGAVALLGADTPGVGNLSDIMASYYAKFTNDKPKNYDENKMDFKFNENKGKESEMTDAEKAAKLELELKLAKEAAEAKDKELKEFTSKQAEKDKEIAALKSQNTENEKKLLELAQKEQEAQIAQFVTTLKSEKLCSPAMEGMIKELLGPEKKEYAVKIDKEDKKLSKQDLLKETLKLFKAASEVNFDENSKDGDDKSKLDEKAFEEKVEKYAAENKLTYGQAMKAILAEQETQNKEE